MAAVTSCKALHEFLSRHRLAEAQPLSTHVARVTQVWMAHVRGQAERGGEGSKTSAPHGSTRLEDVVAAMGWSCAATAALNVHHRPGSFGGAKALVWTRKTLIQVFSLPECVSHFSEQMNASRYARLQRSSE